MGVGFISSGLIQLFYLALSLCKCGFYTETDVSITLVHLFNFCDFLYIHVNVSSHFTLSYRVCYLLSHPYASLMCPIHLHFKTFPHFPASIWIFLPLKYLGPSSLHSSRQWMVSSEAAGSRHTLIFDWTQKCYMWKPH